ncbi:unnamed protein product, partial [Adineta steineri]
KSSYFEFHYKILIKSTKELIILKKLCGIQLLYLAHNTFRETSNNEMYYFVTMRLFNVGRIYAFRRNDYMIEFLTDNNFPPLKIKKEFVVYDSDIYFDHRYQSYISTSYTTFSFITNTNRKYRLLNYNKSRKVFRRSTDS